MTQSVDDSDATPSEGMKKLLSAPIAFGLRAQGHFDTVRNMRRDGHSWEEVGRAIGWVPGAVERFYESERLDA